MNLLLKHTSPLLFFLFLNIISSASLADEKLVVVCNEKNIPACFEDESGNIVGVDVEIVQELSKHLNLNIEIKLVPWEAGASFIGKG